MAQKLIDQEAVIQVVFAELERWKKEMNMPLRDEDLICLGASGACSNLVWAVMQIPAAARSFGPDAATGGPT